MCSDCGFTIWQGEGLTLHADSLPPYPLSMQTPFHAESPKADPPPQGRQIPAGVDRMTDACENITSPILHIR